ncbi:hypothetical protein AJOOGB_AJOOGB_17430, partial [Dysosmobacter welbionis]
RCAFARKKIGTPTAAAMEKQMSCRLVKLNMTFVLTRLRSFGTGTNAIDFFLLSKLLFVAQLHLCGILILLRLTLARPAKPTRFALTDP